MKSYVFKLCRKNSLGVVFGRRSGDRGHILCHRCCDESVCIQPALTTVMVRNELGFDKIYSAMKER